ncbi:glycosyltransferase [Corynebacterium sp. H130]|uniref:glycosyltransferase n=1 Tax=Corynebacterium sp. H130 TaxID=3133444 RepID=UPI0030A605B1
MTALEPGITVVIPTVNAGESLARALDSLARQSLSPQLFDVVVVVNGVGALETQVDVPAGLSVRIIRTAQPGAGRARNLGLAAVRREYVTFLDDDDVLETNFLLSAFPLTGPNTCVLLPIVDLEGERRNEHNSLNVRIKSFQGQTVPAHAVPWAFGFNACKVIPTSMARSAHFPTDLRSGEDVAYFAQVMAQPRLAVSVAAVRSDQAYVRTVRADSVSRKEASFDFNVVQRLECIAHLRAIPTANAARRAIDSLESAQFAFVRDYLSQHPDEVTDAIDRAVELRLPGLPWQELRRDKASTAVYSYCFPPYADPSANVVAKYIRQRGELVDVYFANMDRVRRLDESVQLIVEPYVVHSVRTKTQPSFTDWNLICDYARKAYRAAARRQRETGTYDEIYSRALWSGSHVAALIHKHKNPWVHWEAEFSDPMAVGIDGRPRAGKLTLNRTTLLLRAMLKQKNFDSIAVLSHFELTELATLVCADSVIFTNHNQRTVMLERYPLPVRELVMDKSVIRHHPVPAPELYSLGESDYQLPKDRLNLGYFGNFYKERGIGDVANALASLSTENAQRITLHVFTSKPTEVRAQHFDLIQRGLLKVNGYEPYLKFLRLAQKCDVLIVPDTTMQDAAFSVNPFLPSKYADYKGSGTPVWGLVTEGSPLSQLDLDYRSELGNVEQATNVLRDLLDSGK